MFCSLIAVDFRASTVPKNHECVRFVRVRPLIKTDLNVGEGLNRTKVDALVDLMQFSIRYFIYSV